MTQFVQLWPPLGDLFCTCGVLWLCVLFFFIWRASLLIFYGSYLCLPILYNYLLFILITHHFLPIFYKYHFMTLFVHMRLLWPILFLCISFLALSLHILRQHVRLPLVILLYTYLLLVTYSVHMKIFDSLLIHPNFDLNSWPSFYSREFYGLFW